MSHDGYEGGKAVECEGAFASGRRMVQINAVRGALTASNQDDLSELNRRLMRVKGFGGAFEGIGFSPDVKALMRKAGIGEKARI